MDLFLRWIKESSAPYWISVHPYSAPMSVIILVLVLAVAFVIYAAVRDAKKKKQTTDNIKDGIRKVEERIDDLEKRIS